MVAQSAHVRALVHQLAVPQEPQCGRTAQRAQFVEALFKRYRRNLLWYVARLVTNRADAEEVVQEAFLRLLGAEGLETDTYRARNYLFTTAINIVRDNHRRRTARAQSAHVPVDELPIETNDPEPADTLDTELGRHIVDSALRDVPPRAREAFRLHFAEELTYARIAMQLGVNKKTIERDINLTLELCRSRTLRWRRV